jgi:SnoaL-like domain
MTTPHPPLDEATLQQWLDDYGAAWEARDPEAAARLFTASATYQETPHAEPFIGREGVAGYWAKVTADQRDVAFDAKILAIENDVGVAEWSAAFRNAAAGVRVELDGVFVLRFEGALCRELREWWFARTEPEPS